MPSKSASKLSNKQTVQPIPYASLSSYVLIIITIISLVLITLVLVLHYAMYTWTEELEKTGCECSNLWHRNIIHWFALVILIVSVFNIILKLSKIESLSFYTGILDVINFILFVIYVGLIFDYITKLKKLECECSESWKRDYGYIASVVYIIYFCIIALIMLLGIFAGVYTYYNIIEQFKTFK